ncbi:MAG: family 20 glycosylhydrolase [Bacillota bacterium]
MKILEKLLPFPQNIIECEGTFLAEGALKAWVAKDVFADKAITHKLSKMNVETCLDELLPPLTLVISAEPCSYDSALFAAQNDLAAPGFSEGYGASVRASGICVKGFDFEGVFWGLTTVELMLDLARDYCSGAVSCCEIQDWPVIGVRGHFDDISRKRVSTIEDFKGIIRRLSRLKINHYGIYLEDFLHLRAYPDIGGYRGKLMPWEVREIVEEGELYKVNVVPFFQLIGHCENLLDMPNYAHLGRKVVQRMSSLDPKNPQARVFLKNCIEEIADLFPCKYFGMGFDETQGLTKEEFFGHANWCASELDKYGKQGIIWIDMINNHWGCDKITGLAQSLIPTNWQYQPKPDGVPFQRELNEVAAKEGIGRKIWGFGGYCNWCDFLPKYKNVMNYADYWIIDIEKGSDAGLFYSQWGDEGYENNRDLRWNIFAYCGELSWRGDSSKREGFEERFELSLFGEVIPEFLAVNEKTDEINEKISYWVMHRKNANSYLRYTRLYPEIFEKAKWVITETEKLISGLKKVKNHKAVAIAHHMITALTIIRSVASRYVFAIEYGNKPVEPGSKHEQALMGIINELRDARELALKDWMINNRFEGSEVSAKVFTDMMVSYHMLLNRTVETRKGFVPVDLNGFYNTNFEDINGVPIGEAVCAGVPFSFAGIDKTQVTVGTGEVLTIDLNTNSPEAVGKLIKDLNLIITTPFPNPAEPEPAVKVSLLKSGEVVKEEVLDAITHCVDWFAPFGEHIWAGGGYAYADKKRVTPAIRPNLFFGLMNVSGFDFGKDGVLADQIIFTVLGERKVEIFALTLEF